jgi:aspartate aminotransferase, mitochondrial
MLFQSFAKNFGIYGERAGCLSVVTGSEEEANLV